MGCSGRYLLALSVVLAWASVTGCSSSDAASKGSGLDCRARSDRADPRDGCYCEKLAAGQKPSQDFPTVSKCDDSYSASAGKTVCCKYSDICTCEYVGCNDIFSPSDCTCGLDQGSGINANSPAVAVCQPPSGGKCCADPDSGTCFCDAYGTTCGTGQQKVQSCTATSVAAKCDTGGVQVTSCSAP